MQLSDINPLLIPTLPVVIAPVIAWFLGRSGISKQVSTIDYLNKRLDILERLNKLHAELTEAPIRPFLDTEIEHCRAFLRQPITFIAQGAEGEAKVGAVAGVEAKGWAEAAAPKAAPPQSRWARFFLTKPAVSTRKRVFKGLFYFFFGAAVLFLLLGLIGLLSGEEPLELSSIQLGINSLFYFGIALLARLAAR